MYNEYDDHDPEQGYWDEEDELDCWDEDAYIFEQHRYQQKEAQALISSLSIYQNQNHFIH
jgi:hypothetical protein